MADETKANGKTEVELAREVNSAAFQQMMIIPVGHGSAIPLAELEAHHAKKAAEMEAHGAAMYEDVVGARMRAAAERGEPINEYGERIEQAQIDLPQKRRQGKKRRSK